jgi:two-component system sensor histidine kinase UhpB
MERFQSLRRRLLRTPLFYKILLANLAVVTLGAIAGTVVTVWHVTTFPQDLHLQLIFFFAAAGLAISFVVNSWVLKRALEPLDRLQQAVDDVRSGAADTRVTLSDNSDERFDRLADTFNQMLNQLEQDAEEMQQLSRLILQAQEDERYRLARELHDEAAQALTSLLVRLRLLERAHDPADAQKRVQELRELTAGALEDVRRVALDLRPTILDDLGLWPALEWRIDELNKHSEMQAHFAARGVQERLPSDVALALYRVAQESLSNATRHAQATNVEVLLERLPAHIVLQVCDDGVGFDPSAPQADGERHGLGLLGMRERMRMIGGQLTIRSAPGEGTTVVAQAPVVPLSPPAAATSLVRTAPLAPSAQTTEPQAQPVQPVPADGTRGR